MDEFVNSGSLNQSYKGIPIIIIIIIIIITILIIKVAEEAFLEVRILVYVQSWCSNILPSQPAVLLC